MLQISSQFNNANQKTLEGWIREYRPGEPVRVDFKAITGLGSAIDRHTHLFHAYPAKLLGAIPAFFLGCHNVTGRSPRLLDPFCGSGTVLVEGLAAGCEVVGCDVNPLARLISSAKTTILPHDRLEVAYASCLARVPPRGAPPPAGPIRLDRWFDPRVARQISRLITAVNGCEDPESKIFLLACLSSVIHRTSLTDPTISVPVKLNPERTGLTANQKADRTKWLKARKGANAFELFEKVFRTNLARMSRLATVASAGGRATLFEDARTFPEQEAIDLVITSPPYGSAQKYVRSTSLSLQWLGLAPDGLRKIEQQTIGREHFTAREMTVRYPASIQAAEDVLDRIRVINPLRAHISGQFLSEMAASMVNIERAVRPGGTIVLVMGDNLVCGQRFKTSQYLTKFALSLGLELEVELIDRIKSRGLITRRAATAGIIDDEWIGVFRKPWR